MTMPAFEPAHPGMEMGSEKEPNEVLLVKKDGSTEVFARHGRYGWDRTE